MPKVLKARVCRGNCGASRVRKAASRLHNFDHGTRWVVRPDGESYGSDSSSHDSLAMSAGYKSEDQAYANGALGVHYDPVTNTIRIEARKATRQAIALAKQIIDKVPAGLAHVAFGEGHDFRSYMGKPTQVTADISGNPRTACGRAFNMWRSLQWEPSLCS
jgi:hypothetical protein